MKLNPFKKLLTTVTLIGAMTALLGCSQSEASSKLEGTPEHPYTIIWYMIGTPQADQEMVMDKLNEYLIQKIGAKVELHIIDWGSYDQKMNVVTISGQPYDIAFTSSWANSYTKKAQLGAFYPLDDLLQKYGQGIIQNVPQIFLDGAKVNGELYAIPTNKEVGRQVVYRVNYPVLQSVGMKMSQFKADADLETLRSMEPFLKAVKHQRKDILPYAVFGNTTYVAANLDIILGELPGAVHIRNSDYKVLNQYEESEFTDFYGVYRDFYKKGYIPSNAAQIDDDPSLVTTGKWALGNAEFQPFADNLWSKSAGYTIKSVPAFQPVITNAQLQGSMMAISINARRPDIDMKFLNLINSDRYVRNLIGSGIEGVHYKYVGKDRIKYLPSHSAYDMPGFAYGNLFMTNLLDGDPADKWQQFESWNATAIKSPLLGFNFDTRPVSAEIAAITSVLAQYKKGLATGQSDPKVYLPLMLRALKTAGSDKLIAEEQRQINVWRAKSSASAAK